MTQYVKHYYVCDETGAACCSAAEPRYKRHPWKEYAGLDVKVWLSDSDGVDVMLAELPDSTSVTTVTHDCGKNQIQVLTEAEFNSVWTPYSAASTLYGEAQEAERNGDDATAATKRTAGDAKMAEATTAIRAL